MKQFYLFLIFAILFSSFCFSDDTQTFKTDEYGNLNVPCYDNDKAPCNITTTCFLTAFYPNTSRFIFNQAMSNNYPDPNFNFTLPSTNVTGTYAYTTVCYDGVEYGSISNYFIINESGDQKEGSILGLYIFLIMYIAILFWQSNNFQMFNYEEDNVNGKKMFFWTGLLHLLILVFVAWFDFARIKGITSLLVTTGVLNGVVIVYFIYIWIIDKALEPIDHAINEGLNDAKEK
jgi:hypothetical protein